MMSGEQPTHIQNIHQTLRGDSWWQDK